MSSGPDDAHGTTGGPPPSRAQMPSTMVHAPFVEGRALGKDPSAPAVGLDPRPGAHRGTERGPRPTRVITPLSLEAVQTWQQHHGVCGAIHRAAGIAVATLRSVTPLHLGEAVLVAFDEPTLERYERLLQT